MVNYLCLVLIHKVSHMCSKCYTPLNMSQICLNNNPTKPVPITPLHFCESFLNCVLSLVSAHNPSCGLNRFSLIKLRFSSVFKCAVSISCFNSSIDCVMWSILLWIRSNSVLSFWFKVILHSLYSTINIKLLKNLYGK